MDNAFENEQQNAGMPQEEQMNVFAGPQQILEDHYDDQDAFFNALPRKNWNMFDRLIDWYRKVSAPEMIERDLYSSKMDASVNKVRLAGNKNYVAEHSKEIGKDSGGVRADDLPNGFITMENSNPMMRFAEEIHEGVSVRPHFSANIGVDHHEHNIATIAQHTYASIHATVFNKTENRVVRYRFAVGLHGPGLLHDSSIGADMVAKKECTYDDVHKAFVYINRFQKERNTTWRLFSTNCNNFVRQLAEYLGMNDIADLMKSTSCVQTYRNMMQAAMDKAGTSKYAEIRFFSEENIARSAKEVDPRDDKYYSVRGDEKNKYYNTLDSHYNRFSSIQQMQDVNSEIKLPLMIMKMDAYMLDFMVKMCGYRDKNKFTVDYGAFVGGTYPKYHIFRRKKFEKVRELFRNLRDVEAKREEARKVLTAVNEEYLEYEKKSFWEYNTKLASGKEGISAEELRQIRGAALRAAGAIMEPALDTLLSQLNGYPSEFRYFVLRCKGTLNGMESMSSVYSNAIDVKDTLDAVGHTYAGVDSEMQYDKIKGDMFNSAFTQEEMDSSMHYYASALDNNENGALSKLGFTFLRSFTDFRSLFSDSKRNVLSNVTDRNGGLADAMMIVGSLQGYLNNLVTKLKEKPNKNHPTYIYIASLLEKQDSWTKDPDKLAWTIVQAILRSISDLWSRVSDQEFVRKGAVKTADHDTVGRYLSLLAMEHQGQASQKASGQSPNGMGTKYDENVYAMENSLIMKSNIIGSLPGTDAHKQAVTYLDGGAINVNFIHDSVKELINMILSDNVKGNKGETQSPAAK